MKESTKPPPTVGALLGSLAAETGTLVRQEIHLASTEMGHKAKHALADLGVVLMGGALVHAGLLFVLAGTVLVLGAFIPWWASAIGLGAVATGVGYALVRKGIAALHGLDPTPQKTIATLRRGTPVLKEHAR
jgi:hypothetical protein